MCANYNCFVTMESKILPKYEDFHSRGHKIISKDMGRGVGEICVQFIWSLVETPMDMSCWHKKSLPYQGLFYFKWRRISRQKYEGLSPGAGGSIRNKRVPSGWSPFDCHEIWLEYYRICFLNIYYWPVNYLLSGVEFNAESLGFSSLKLYSQ